MSVDTVAYIKSRYRSNEWKEQRETVRRQRIIMAERDALRALTVARHDGSPNLGLICASEVDIEERQCFDRIIRRSSWKLRLAEINRAREARGIDDARSLIQNTHCVYLIANTWIDAIKIGVTSPRQRRLQRWIDANWVLIDTWTVTDDRNARQLERHIIKYWRIQCRSGYGGNEIDYPDNGMTETARHTQVSLHETLALIDRVHADLENG